MSFKKQGDRREVSNQGYKGRGSNQDYTQRMKPKFGKDSKSLKG